MAAMKVKDFIITERHYDPHVDGYLVLGHRRRKTKTLKNHVVGWVSRHDDMLRESRFFLDAPSAKKYFSDAQLDENARPEDSFFLKDFQQKRLYAWEERTLMPHALWTDEKQAKSLIRKVSRDYSIPAPKLVMEEETWNSEYDDETNTIHYGGRDNISLLHEMAHAIHTHQLDGENMAHHSPGFVWLAIELYSKYAGLNLNYLLLSAASEGLLGDINERQVVDAESQTYRKVSQNARRLHP